MVNYNNIISSIVVDGHPLPEYGIRYDPEKALISCWVASQTGKEFHITLQRHTREYVTIGDFFVDGENVACLVAACTAKQDILRCQGIQISSTMRRPLLFSRTMLTDDEALRNIEVSPDLGTIRVEYRRATLQGRAEGYQPIYVALSGHVHESQKPSAHSAALGARQYTVSLKGQRCVEPGELILAFLFRYAPLEHLQAVGVAPRNPPPQTFSSFLHSTRSPTPLQTSPARKCLSPSSEREYIMVDSDTDEEEGGSSLGPGENPGSGSAQAAHMDGDDELEMQKLEAILAVAKLEEQITDLKGHRKSWEPNEYQVALERLEARLKVLKAEEQLVTFKCAQYKKRQRNSNNGLGTSAKIPFQVKQESPSFKKRQISQAVKQERRASTSASPLKQ
ncbi:hypothetical protein CYLTODRAFT_418318 [Cylindrobasidium torrendii FP15055 ss-10]|uniref:DUF7918 domain-containing protein n=1 Tax=Cylindrobasidium torrendii FP15055 ss-10 TaxID=1314674 RepID=A0A0D7BP01_9AGAR|nr:hypothetical protein CYLTODRAFT_418318 [Cylindrobasidium torrendii FP15055 ss-10]